MQRMPNATVSLPLVRDDQVCKAERALAESNRMWQHLNIPILKERHIRDRPMISIWPTRGQHHSNISMWRAAQDKSPWKSTSQQDPSEARDKNGKSEWRIHQIGNLYKLSMFRRLTQIVALLSTKGWSQMHSRWRHPTRDTFLLSILQTLNTVVPNSKWTSKLWLQRPPPIPQGTANKASMIHACTNLHMLKQREKTNTEQDKKAWAIASRISTLLLLNR